MNKSGTSSTVTERLAALSEMVRLRILRLVEREELSVGEIAKIAQLPQSTVSRHLKILLDGGWVAKRSEGTATLYRMVPDDVPPQERALWTEVRTQLENPRAPELEEDLRRLKSALAERRSDSQSFFGRVAGSWDALRQELFGEQVVPGALGALASPSWVVADLGCGTGNAAELLAPHVREVIAIDQSGPMLDAASKRLTGVDNVRFVEGALESLPLDDDSVDLSICVLVVHHLESPVSAFREMSRVTRSGGLVVIIDMLAHERESYRHTMGHRWLGFSEETMETMLAEAGVVEARFSELPPSPSGLGPGLFVCRGMVPTVDDR